MRVPVLNGRPDLRLYSQESVFESGAHPTWLNPDITTFRGTTGNAIRPAERVTATITNRSRLAPALGALVSCHIAELGIGAPRSALPSQSIDVPAGGSVTVSFPVGPTWTSQERPFAAFVRATLPGDPTPTDNAGAQVAHGVYTSQAGRSPTLTFPVVNRASNERHLTLTVVSSSASASVAPDVLVLPPMGRELVELSVTIPTSSVFTGYPLQLEEVTVIATEAPSTLVGGLTFFVAIDD